MSGWKHGRAKRSCVRNKTITNHHRVVRDSVLASYQHNFLTWFAELRGFSRAVKLSAVVVRGRRRVWVNKTNALRDTGGGHSQQNFGATRGALCCGWLASISMLAPSLSWLAEPSGAVKANKLTAGHLGDIVTERREPRAEMFSCPWRERLRARGCQRAPHKSCIL